jgi:hypothetical protein
MVVAIDQIALPSFVNRVLDQFAQGKPGFGSGIGRMILRKRA